MEVLLDGTALASKRVVYVGGIGEDATTKIIRAAFIPFGPVQAVDIVR